MLCVCNFGMRVQFWKGCADTTSPKFPMKEEPPALSKDNITPLAPFISRKMSMLSTTTVVLFFPRFSIVDEGSLRISGVQDEDEGSYQCVAKSVVGSRDSRKASLFVQGQKPMFKEPFSRAKQTAKQSHIFMPTVEC